MAPLFTENQEESLKKSGKLITWKNNKFEDIEEDAHILNPDKHYSKPTFFSSAWNLGSERTLSKAGSILSQVK